MAFYGILESDGLGYRGNVSWQVVPDLQLLMTSSVEAGMMNSNS